VVTVGFRASHVDNEVAAICYELLESSYSGLSVFIAVNGWVEVEAGVVDVQLPGWSSEDVQVGSSQGFCC
jgi:hypothetical protein